MSEAERLERDHEDAFALEAIAKQLRIFSAEVLTSKVVGLYYFDNGAFVNFSLMGGLQDVAMANARLQAYLMKKMMELNSTASKEVL